MVTKLCRFKNPRQWPYKGPYQLQSLNHRYSIGDQTSYRSTIRNHISCKTLKMSIYPNRMSHALSPAEQADYINAARGLRLTGFITYGPSEETRYTRNQKAVRFDTYPRQMERIPEIPRQRQRKLAFRQTFLDKIKGQYERVCAAARRRLLRSSADPEEAVLRRLRKEIQREEQRSGDWSTLSTDEALDQKLRIARLVHRGTREELRRRHAKMV